MKSKETIKAEISAIREKMDDKRLAQGTANTYSRISGYYRATSGWNDGKLSEFNDRKEYNIAKA